MANPYQAHGKLWHVASVWAFQVLLERPADDTENLGDQIASNLDSSQVRRCGVECVGWLGCAFTVLIHLMPIYLTA